ncbi:MULTISPECIES: type III secretion system HrpP C-terminal domain-containing protein [Pseudomonas]|uniref:Flagellar hook-length control protein FliK n=1 Tax=Pseudomonas salomonii TaxID=191391 RepID=A0A1H3BQI4_9PSED|nr:MULTISPECIES: type III secretion system HrpP C-terminal domain-containing protein [Pseudomonas]NWF09244.1 flagellar hook-length control protein FliK [Pseudomonas salomonii]CRM41348.1 hypothetical protein [Pseudomonas sp. 58 R 3]SDX44183.1 hypothetical protein SAMN05216247_10146 [Pseudomonas salomonii]
MTQVSNTTPEHRRTRELRQEREPGVGGYVPLEQGRLFAHLLAGGAAEKRFGHSRLDIKASVEAARADVLIEQLVAPIQAGAQWPLQFVLCMPRQGRINALVHRDQNAWAIELDAQDDATNHWLRGVRQQCQERCTQALGQTVRLYLPGDRS